MQAIFAGIFAAIILAAAAALVLDVEVQQDVEQRYQTTGVRL